MTHFLIGKSILETLLVGALALFGFMSLVPPYFHGWGEVTPTSIAGWAVNNAAPWDRVEVELYIDGKLQGRAVANQSRPDVSAAGWAKDEWHGYSFSIANPESGSHEARIYALHHSSDGARKSLQLLGEPIPFIVDEQGRLKAAPK